MIKPMSAILLLNMRRFCLYSTQSLCSGPWMGFGMMRLWQPCVMTSSKPFLLNELKRS